MRRSLWLLAFVMLGACTDSHGPNESTQTGNPPVLDKALVTLEVSAGEVHITGGPDAVSPGGARIVITNLSTGEVIEGEANADGSFDVRVDGSLNDAFSVRVSSDGETSPPVYVVRGGAAIEGDDDGSLSCDQYQMLIGAVLDGSAAAAQRSCDDDQDCVAVPKVAKCFNDCGFAYVASNGQAQIEASAEVLDDSLCSAFAQHGCQASSPDCGGPEASICLEGRCAPTSAGQLSCEERREMVDDAIDELIETVDRTCERDEECLIAKPGTGCHPACTEVAVSQAGNAELESELVELEALCGIEDAGCSLVLARCPAMAVTEPRCQVGQCALVPIDNDASVPDCVTCFEQTLQWNYNGGFIPYQDTSEIAPCAQYKHRRMFLSDPETPELSCESELLACNAAASTGAVLSALSNADVQEALASSPVLYGMDARGVDGQVFQIRLGTQLIEVGYPCRDTMPASSCVSVPAGVEALAELLQSIDQGMLATDACAVFTDE